MSLGRTFTRLLGLATSLLAAPFAGGLSGPQGHGGAPTRKLVQGRPKSKAARPGRGNHERRAMRMRTAPLLRGARAGGLAGQCVEPKPGTAYAVQWREWRPSSSRWEGRAKAALELSENLASKGEGWCYFDALGEMVGAFRSCKLAARAFREYRRAERARGAL